MRFNIFSLRPPRFEQRSLDDDDDDEKNKNFNFGREGDTYIVYLVEYLDREKKRRKKSKVLPLFARRVIRMTSPVFPLNNLSHSTKRTRAFNP